MYIIIVIVTLKCTIEDVCTYKDYQQNTVRFPEHYYSNIWLSVYIRRQFHIPTFIDERNYHN